MYQDSTLRLEIEVDDDNNVILLLSFITRSLLINCNLILILIVVCLH